MTKKTKIIVISAIAVVLIAALVLTLVLVLGKDKDSKAKNNGERVTQQTEQKEPDTFKITFDPDEGEFAEGTVSEFTAKTGDVLKDIVGDTPVPIKEGYEFVCWQNGKSVYDEKKTVKYDITFTANWRELEKYTITFDAAEGSFDEEAITEFVVIEGQSLGEVGVDPIATRAGYDLDNWYYGEEAFDLETVVTEDRTYTAKWVPMEGVLTSEYLERDGGKWKTTVNMMKVLEANDIANLPTGFESDAKLTGYFVFDEGKVSIYATEKGLKDVADDYLEDLISACEDDEDMMYSALMSLYGLDSKSAVDDYMEEEYGVPKIIWKALVIPTMKEQDPDELVEGIVDENGQYILVKSETYTVDPDKGTVTIDEDTFTVGSMKDDEFKITAATGANKGYKGAKLKRQ
ncbi:MAG: hypothetical protein E7652_04800 [Ruminococcaceae bacterium]|nr:hypothetical protein [Oscillospiraceae bacterium]